MVMASKPMKRERHNGRPGDDETRWTPSYPYRLGREYGPVAHPVGEGFGREDEEDPDQDHLETTRIMFTREVLVMENMTIAVMQATWATTKDPGWGLGKNRYM